MGRTKKINTQEEAYYMPFPKRLRELLDRPGETQGKLADGIGVNRQSIGQWKDGITTPDINALSKIADYFKVSSDFLLGRADDKNPNMEIRAINEMTGLSSDSINMLINNKNYRLYEGTDTFLEAISPINMLIRDKNMMYVAASMVEYVKAKSYYNKEKAEYEKDGITPQLIEAGLKESANKMYFEYWKLEHFSKLWATESANKLEIEFDPVLKKIFKEKEAEEEASKQFLGSIDLTNNSINFNVGESNSHKE